MIENVHIVFQYKPNKDHNNEIITVCDDGRLEVYTILSTFLRDEDKNESNKILSMKDISVTNEILDFIELNKNLLESLPQNLSTYSDNETVEIILGKHSFSVNDFSKGFRIGYSRLNNYKKELYRIVFKIRGIILKYTEPKWNWIFDYNIKELLLLPDQYAERTFSAKYMNESHMGNQFEMPVLFSYKPGPLALGSSVYLLIDGTLISYREDYLEDKLYCHQDVIARDLQLARSVKSIIRKYQRKIKAIPKEFVIKRPYKELSQQVTFMNQVFSADRLFFPIEEELQVQGITLQQLRLIHKLFFKIVRIINKKVSDQRPWDINLYLNYEKEFSLWEGL